MVHSEKVSSLQLLLPELLHEDKVVGLPSDDLTELLPTCENGCTTTSLEPFTPLETNPDMDSRLMYGKHNPIKFSSQKGRIDSFLDYSMASLVYPLHGFRPESSVRHSYPGAMCPIVDKDIAIFETHGEGPFLHERRTMLRNKIQQTDAFACGDYERSLYDGFESMDAYLCGLAGLAGSSSSTHPRVLGCGAYSMVFIIVRGHMLYTGGLGGWCALLHPEETRFGSQRLVCDVRLPVKSSIGSVIVALERKFYEVLEVVQDYFTAPAIEVNKACVGSGSVLVIFGEPKEKFITWIEAGVEDLHRWCVDNLCCFGMECPPLTSPLVLVRFT